MFAFDINFADMQLLYSASELLQNQGGFGHRRSTCLAWPRSKHSEAVGVLPDFEKRELTEYYFGLVQKMAAEDVDLTRQFPEQFKPSSTSPNRVGGRATLSGAD